MYGHANGSRSELRTLLPGARFEHHKRLVILPNRQHINIAESVGMKSTGAPWPNSTSEKFKLSRPRPGENCMLDSNGQTVFSGYTMAGREKVGELLTVKMVRSAPYPIEAWHALALGCEEVQRKIGFPRCCNVSPGPNESVTNTSEFRLINYRLGEPDAHLFDVSSFKGSTSKRRDPCNDETGRLSRRASQKNGHTI